MQCQRSPNNTILAGVHYTDGVWACPGEPYSPECPGGETYRLILDDWLLEAMAAARRHAERRFGPAHLRGTPTVLIEGEHPECVYETHANLWSIYLQRDSNANQLRGQLAHEVFHRVCSPGKGVFHWTHEMLAEVFKVEHLRASGHGAYADVQVRAHHEKASVLPVELLVAVENAEYPDGIYACAFVAGQQLLEELSWEFLAPLARCFDPSGVRTSRGSLSGFPMNRGRLQSAF